MQQLHGRCFHSHLLMSHCSRTVDFYGMGLVPVGCKTSTLVLSDAVCVCVCVCSLALRSVFP